MVKREELEKYLNELLNINEFDDYGPNGLQVQGQESISKVAFAVSATQKSIHQTLEAGADALIVHHGLFWVFHGPRPITGPFSKRVKPLIQNDINLFGYHLPLDAHPTYGNAKALANRIELTQTESFGDRKGSPLGVKGVFNKAMEAHTLREKLEQVLNHPVLHANVENKKIQSVGIITGGANSGWQEACQEGLDAYITGEMSEHDWHESAEAGVHMFAGGHNATEVFGVQEIMKLIESKFHLECLYFPSENPA